jgi:hypothetical protein
MSFKPVAASGVSTDSLVQGSFVDLLLDGMGPTGQGLRIYASQWPMLLQCLDAITLNTSTSLTLEGATAILEALSGALQLSGNTEIDFLTPGIVKIDPTGAVEIKPTGALTIEPAGGFTLEGLSQQTTVGTAGGASAPPATPAAYLLIQGYAIPAYKAS